MKIEKSFVIDAPRARVWDLVSTPEEVGMCFPGCQSVTKLDEDKYEAAIKVHIGPIKTVFDVQFEVTEKRQGEYMAYVSRGEEGNRASRLKANSTLTLSSLEAQQTEIVYTSDMSIVGRLGKFGLGMMKKKAETMGDEFVAQMRTAIEEPKSGEAVVEPKVSNWPKILTTAIIAAIVLYILYMLLR